MGVQHRFILSVAVSVSFLIHSSAALALGEFKQNNPDHGKLAFAKSYISALSYLKAINERWEKNSPKKVFIDSDVTLMRGYVSFIIKDNMDLRIAKNYLAPYLQSNNLLVRKTADTFITACMTEIAINEKEKQIWDQWYAVKSNKFDTKNNEKAFVKAQQELSEKRKTSRNAIIEATMLLTSVLKSERNLDEKGRILALTRKERKALLNYLDETGRDVLDWGIKPGQDHWQASVALIREVLEDPLYTTLNE